MHEVQQQQKNAIHPEKISREKRVEGLCSNQVFMAIAVDSFKNYSLCVVVAEPLLLILLKISSGTVHFSVRPSRALSSLSGMWKIITFLGCVVHSVIQIQMQQKLLRTYYVPNTLGKILIHLGIRPQRGISVFYR